MGIAGKGGVIVDGEGNERVVLGLNEESRDLDVLEELV